MRNLLLTLAVVLGFLVVPVHHSAAIASPVALAAASLDSAALDQQAAPQVNVEVHRDGRVWYANPVWIAIGVIAAVVVILLIVMAAKGGGTTVVKG